MENERRVKACLEVCAAIPTEVLEKNGFSLVPILGEELNYYINTARKLKSIVEDMQEYFMPQSPEKNCSCHICSPCGDCVEYALQREIEARIEGINKVWRDEW